MISNLHFSLLFSHSFLNLFLFFSWIQMENYRSKSCKIDTFYDGKATAPTSMQDLRCFSASYATPTQPNDQQLGKKSKLKKSKSTFGSASKSWSFNDPELQRKKRVASYKVYTVEGKMKGSLRKSLKWVKNTYTQIVHGWQ